MMQKNTKKKLPAILSAVVIVVLLCLFLAVFISALKGDDPGMSVLWTIVILYGVPIVAVIIGVIFALRQRVKEIDSGEEEDAKKY